MSPAVALDSSNGADARAGEMTGKMRRQELGAYRNALAADLVLNASWSWLFWRARRP